MKEYVCFGVLIVALIYGIFSPTNISAFEKPSTTYNRAQVVEWISDDVFVVGRWDGTLSVFREPISNKEYGPVIVQALTTPGRKGIEMIQKIEHNFIVTSNNSRSIAVWSIHNNILLLKDILQYEPKVGIANASTAIIVGSKLWLVVGHANGFVTQWVYDNESFHFVRRVDVRTSSNPANPFNLYNVRGVVPLENDLVLLGSEDGDISIYNISIGKIIYRKRYNPEAKRGINSVFYSDGLLILGNCSVGMEDKNLWLYKVSDNTIKFVDSINLVKDTSLEQVFNFDVEIYKKKGKIYFYASTYEGLMWVGEIENEKLKPVASEKVAFNGAAALDIDPDKNNIAAISHAILLYPLYKN